MPIYEYQCSACEHIFEILTSAGSVTKEVHCSKCQSDKVSKIISAGSFRLRSGSSRPCAAQSPGCASKSGFS